jgi:hypothetical protein
LLDHTDETFVHLSDFVIRAAASFAVGRERDRSLSHKQSIANNGMVMSYPAPLAAASSNPCWAFAKKTFRGPPLARSRTVLACVPCASDGHATQLGLRPSLHRLFVEFKPDQIESLIAI